jgi:hypothetical protein
LVNIAQNLHLSVLLLLILSTLIAIFARADIVFIHLRGIVLARR